MRRKINGEAYLIIKKNYTLIIRNSNSDPKITLLIEPTTITTYKFSFFLLRLSKHNFYPDQSSVSQRLLSSQKLLNRTISKSLFPENLAFPNPYLFKHPKRKRPMRQKDALKKMSDKREADKIV